MPLPFLVAPAIYGAAATGATTTAVLSTSWMGAFVAANASAIAATSFAVGAGAGAVAAGAITTSLTWFGGTMVGGWALGLFGYTTLPIVGVVSSTTATVIIGALALAGALVAGTAIYTWRRRKARKADREFVEAVTGKLEEINESRQSYGEAPYQSVEEFMADLQAYKSKAA